MMLDNKIEVHFFLSRNWSNVYIVTFWNVIIFNVGSFNLSLENMLRCTFATFRLEIPWFGLNSMVTGIAMSLLMITATNDSWIFLRLCRCWCPHFQRFSPLAFHFYWNLLFFELVVILLHSLYHCWWLLCLGKW